MQMYRLSFRLNIYTVWHSQGGSEIRESFLSLGFFLFLELSAGKWAGVLGFHRE